MWSFIHIVIFTLLTSPSWNARKATKPQAPKRTRNKRRQITSVQLLFFTGPSQFGSCWIGFPWGWAGSTGSSSWFEQQLPIFKKSSMIQRSIKTDYAFAWLLFRWFFSSSFLTSTNQGFPKFSKNLKAGDVSCLLADVSTLTDRRQPSVDSWLIL